MFITLFVSNFMSLAENGVAVKNLELMQQHFETINRVLKQSVATNVSVKVFKRNCLVKVIVVIAFFLLGLILPMLIPVTERINYFTSLYEEILWLLLRFANLHVIFYIDLGQHFLEAFNELTFSANDLEIEDLEMVHSHAVGKNITSKFNSCRYMYLKLWQITHLIEKTFGWTMTSVCMQDGFRACYTIYNLFVVMQDQGISEHLLGKCVFALALELLRSP